MTPLHYACKSGIVGIVSHFMISRDNNGWTVLHHAHACAKGRKRVVIELLKKVVDLGIDLDTSDNNRWTALD